MKEEELTCKTKRRFKATTDLRHNKPVADNLLERDFHRDQPNQAIFEYIEVFYNRQRKHSSNGYLAPFKYEQQLAKAA